MYIHDLPEQFPPPLEINNSSRQVRCEPRHCLAKLLQPFSTCVFLREQSENVCEDILQLGQGVNAVEIDLMEPLDPEKTPR